MLLIQFPDETDIKSRQAGSYWFHIEKITVRDKSVPVVLHFACTVTYVVRFFPPPPPQ